MPETRKISIWEPIEPRKPRRDKVAHVRGRLALHTFLTAQQGEVQTFDHAVHIADTILSSDREQITVGLKVQAVTLSAGWVMPAESCHQVFVHRSEPMGSAQTKDHQYAQPVARSAWHHPAS